MPTEGSGPKIIHKREPSLGRVSFVWMVAKFQPHPTYALAHLSQLLLPMTTLLPVHVLPVSEPSPSCRPAATREGNPSREGPLLDQPGRMSDGLFPCERVAVGRPSSALPPPPAPATGRVGDGAEMMGMMMMMWGLERTERNAARGSRSRRPSVTDIYARVIGSLSH